jgi:hypothetical protein
MRGEAADGQRGEPVPKQGQWLRYVLRGYLIFEADLPPEQYAYRPGRNAQQAVVEVGALLYRGHPEVVDRYDAVPMNFLDEIAKRWRRVLNRCSEKGDINWARMERAD